MLRLLAFVAAVALFAACASLRAEDEQAAPLEQATAVFLPPDPAHGVSMLVAPAVVLQTLGGRQEAVHGSSCVATEEGGGLAVCRDPGAVHPEWLSVVHPGETVTLALDGASLTGSPGVARARRLGCTGEAATFSLERSPTDWAVSLPPGAYELEITVSFETDDGRSGDVSGALGLLVDPEREPGIVAASVSSGVSC